ncbi:MAG TPA: ATP-binding cassette domain-containing protein, partial [Bacteroidia bacterium]|nr:ATP-binding cassette domain-containing protein [Bacteroidia bacterium]
MENPNSETGGPVTGQSGVLLEVRNLVTEFRTENETVKAVNDTSFIIRAGETIGIVGESGSGKSVTALSAMRLIPNPPGRISSGEILYSSRGDWKVKVKRTQNRFLSILYACIGRAHKTKIVTGGVVDLVKLSEKEMRQLRGNEIAMIFQEPMTSLNPVYTCGEQVCEAILQHWKDPSVSATRNRLELLLRWFYKWIFIRGLTVVAT